MGELSYAIINSASRFRTKLDWLDSYHSFSFNNYYDPNNVNFGLMVVNNEDWIAPSGRFGTHGHSDMEIITWVIDGELEHKDSAGNEGIIYPGLVQRMSAGSGIKHSEANPSDVKPVHLVQMWVYPDILGISPSYEQVDFNGQISNNDFTLVASGDKQENVVYINQADAKMLVGRLGSGQTLQLPKARYAHLFVVKGSIEFEGQIINAGDAIRAENLNNNPITAASEDIEIILWIFSSSIE